MFAVGCIVAELLLRVALFPGDSDLGQLSKIFEVLGTPNENNWPDHTSLPDYCEFKPTTPIALRDIFTAASDDLLAVIDNLLRLNPNERCSAKLALQLPYFRFVNKNISSIIDIIFNTQLIIHMLYVVFLIQQ